MVSHRQLYGAARLAYSAESLAQSLAWEALDEWLDGNISGYVANRNQRGMAPKLAAKCCAVLPADMTDEICGILQRTPVQLARLAQQRLRTNSVIAKDKLRVVVDESGINSTLLICASK